MAAVRSFAAVHLIGLGSTVTAQNLVITVIDLSGAFVPGANIRIVWLPGAAQKDSDWLHYAFHASEQAMAHSDATGEATVGLAKGNYAIAHRGPGIPTLLRKDRDSRSAESVPPGYPRRKKLHAVRRGIEWDRDSGGTRSSQHLYSPRTVTDDRCYQCPSPAAVAAVLSVSPPARKLLSY